MVFEQLGSHWNQVYTLQAPPEISPLESRSWASSSAFEHLTALSKEKSFWFNFATVYSLKAPKNFALLTHLFSGFLQTSRRWAVMIQLCLTLMKTTTRIRITASATPIRHPWGHPAMQVTRFLPAGDVMLIALCPTARPHSQRRMVCGGSDRLAWEALPRAGEQGAEQFQQTAPHSSKLWTNKEFKVLFHCIIRAVLLSFVWRTS